MGNSKWLEKLVENYKLPNEESKHKEKMLTEQQLKNIRRSKDS